MPFYSGRQLIYNLRKSDHKDNMVIKISDPLFEGSPLNWNWMDFYPAIILSGDG